MVVLLAALTTALLTLDSTVVLLTPVVVATARRMHVPVTPHATACAHIANSGSLLLPVSNLTNLLAFAASGLGFGRFAALMALPWLLAVTVDWLALRVGFAGQLRVAGMSLPETPPAPTGALLILLATTAGFVILPILGYAPVWAAVGGAVVMMMKRSTHHHLSLSNAIRVANPAFLLFVASLAVIVTGVGDHGVHEALARVLPTGTGLADLLAIAGIAAVAANMVNNLPATLIVLPLVAGTPLAVLAVLIGVNVGPNLTWSGSLATLLWRRRLAIADRPSTARFTVLGVVSAVPGMVLATVGLWIAAVVVGTT